MLHKILIGLYLFSTSALVVAQEDDSSEETEASKRPSWSAGLPERTKSADLNKPDIRQQIDSDIELDMSDFGLQEKPEIEMELPIGETMVVKPKTPAEQEADRLAAEQAEAERLAAEQAEAERLAAEQAEAERLAAEQAEAERLAAAQAEAERLAAEQAEAERLAAEQAEAERLAAAQAEAERLAAEQAEAERLAAEQAEAERLAAEQLAAEQNNAEEVVEIPTEQSIASVEPPVTQDPNPVAAAAEQAEYDWNIIKREPVQYPVKAAIENLEGWVDVEVTIDPAGNVVSVSPVKYSRRGRVFGKPAVQSVSNWQFTPPSEIGITENITRVYKIEFNL